MAGQRGNNDGDPLWMMIVGFTEKGAGPFSPQQLVIFPAGSIYILDTGCS
jgi:hypothetical protein